MIAEKARKFSPLEVDPNKDVSYINLTLLDASKTIETKVAKKLRESTLRIFSKESVREKIASAAGKRITPGMVAKGLSDKMPKLLMYTVHQKIGMTVAARTVFAEDAYIVIEFQVKRVDTQKLLAKVQEGVPEGMDDAGDDADDDMEVPPEVLETWIKKMQDEDEQNDEAAAPPHPASDADQTENSNKGWSWSRWIAAQSEYVVTKLLPEGAKRDLEQTTMPAFVQSKITREMGSIMQQKMTQKHIVAEIAVLPGESQARYFYSNLESLRSRRTKK